MTNNIPDAPGCQLYIITPPKLVPEAFAPHLERALDEGNVAALQLRLEEANEQQWEDAIGRLMPIAHAREVSFIINNHVELCAKTGADGVHLGIHDMRISEARKILGPDKTIGASCLDSKHLGMTAAEQGADYVSFGPFFTARSPYYPQENYAPKYMVSPNILTWWSAIMDAPCVAAGGIKPANCRDIVKAGADFICASTSIWEYTGGAAAAIREFQEAMGHIPKKVAG